jgi:hypothetical protein
VAASSCFPAAQHRSRGVALGEKGLRRSARIDGP